MRYTVDLIAGPIPDGADIADIADRMADVLPPELPDAAVGGRVDLRTIGFTVEVEAPGLEEALRRAVTSLERVSRSAGMEADLPVIGAEVALSAETAPAGV